MLRYALLCMILIGGSVRAHQFTPTYPVLGPSFVSGVMQTRMMLFNKRQDVEYYEVGVFTEKWEPVPFATENRFIQVKYLQTKPVNVYVRSEDAARTVYICTESRMRQGDAVGTVIASRICSKVKH